MRDTDGVVSTNVATFVRSARRAKGITAEDLADELGVDRKTLIRLESGENKRVDLGLFIQICSALDIRPSTAIAAVMPDAEDMPLPPPPPRAIARLIDNFNALAVADQPQLLERVEWVNEYIELWMRQREERRANRRHG